MFMLYRCRLKTFRGCVSSPPALSALAALAQKMTGSSLHISFHSEDHALHQLWDQNLNLGRCNVIIIIIIIITLLLLLLLLHEVSNAHDTMRVIDTLLARRPQLHRTITREGRRRENIRRHKRIKQLRPRKKQL